MIPRQVGHIEGTLSTTDPEAGLQPGRSIDAMRAIRHFALILILAWPLGARAAEDQLTAHRLFHIERNKNANIVVYDAEVLPDGNLPAKDPVVVYWLKLAEDGARKKLKGIEKRLAYGFEVRSRHGNRLVLKMKADVGREVLVDRFEGIYRAFIVIDERWALLDRIYIFADESGILPSVEYIELFGVDVETGEEVHEKYLP